MPTLTVSAAPRGRVKCEVRDGDTLLALDTINPAKEKERVSFAKRIKVADSWLLQHLEVGTYDYTDTSAPAADAPIRFRAVREPRSTARVLVGSVADNIVSLVGSGESLSGRVLEWDDPGQASVLDVDYHHLPIESRPTPERLAFLVARLQPQPLVWWVSKGRGVHAVYERRQYLAANVLAAVAGFCWTGMDPSATFEVKSDTFAPPGQVHTVTGTSDLSPVAKFLRGGVGEDEVTEYLQDRGMEYGKAYEHSYCPLEPDRSAQREPVYVGESGIICKSCEARGLCLGSRRPGYFPYSTLCGGHEYSEVSRMVRYFTHWTHASVVLDSSCRLRGEVARLVYEGMLRLVHGADERVDRAFLVGEHVIRGQGRWVTPDRYETLKDIRPTLSSFPAVLSKELKPIPERLDFFDQTVELSRYGYPPIHPIHGLRIFGEFLGHDGGPVTCVLPPTTLAEPSQAALRPRYVPSERRLPLEEAWQRVEEVFPRINRNYLLLLVAARGVSEGETGLAPNIVCVGPSGSGKSQTVQLAASITGDACGEIQWTPSEERFRQGYMRAVGKGSYVVVDELIKSALRARQTPRAAFDYFLTLTPGSTSHEMYVGQVPLGRLPVTVVTETFVPSEVRADVQLARRFVYVRLLERLGWEETIVSAAIGTPGRFRASSIERAEACNAIVSHVIDRFFSERARPLSDIAQELGFTTLEHCDEVLDDPDALIRLYTTTLAAPDWHDTRLKGRGWKRVVFGGETDLDTAWSALCDGENSMSAFSSSRRVQEVDWSTVAAIPIGSRCDVSVHGKSLAIRFRLGEARGRGDYFVNEELLTCPGERRETANSDKESPAGPPIVSAPESVEGSPS